MNKMTKEIFLPFEKPVEALTVQLDKMQTAQKGVDVDIDEELHQIKQKSEELLHDIYSNLSPWEVTQVARHPSRPYTLDYVNHIFDDFIELHGDRHFADDPAIVTGLGWLQGRACAIVGHQKGRDIKERTFRNFGMPKPEGYRKALRIMKMAEKFSMPLFCFIDTPGAYPGIDAEERGQSEAIGKNILEMLALKTPIIATIIGEGGSGGALAVATADKVLMLENSVYSVISPEGCAAILWKTAEKASVAADALGITAERLKGLGLIDEVIAEPLGGAHRDWGKVIQNVKHALQSNLDFLEKDDACWRHRKKKFLDMGFFST